MASQDQKTGRNRARQAKFHDCKRAAGLGAMVVWVTQQERRVLQAFAEQLRRRQSPLSLSAVDHVSWAVYVAADAFRRSFGGAPWALQRLSIDPQLPRRIREAAAQLETEIQFGAPYLKEQPRELEAEHDRLVLCSSPR
jgi:hypothetical protein